MNTHDEPGISDPPKKTNGELFSPENPGIFLSYHLNIYLRTQYSLGVLDQPVLSNKKQLIELNPRFRKDQTFYQELTKLIKVVRKRRYYTPFILLVVIHYTIGSIWSTSSMK
jgi:hypothetical protein